MQKPLKCVWSGYPSHDHPCRSRVPASVVLKAWRREMQLKATEEGFFNFTWRSGVWLAFGLKDGGVRGVYCPTHCSERDSRTLKDASHDKGRPKGTRQADTLKGTPHGGGQASEVRAQDRRTDRPEGVALQ